MAKQEQHHEKTRHENRQLYRLAACLVGAATLLLQSCSGNRNCDRLCGSWSSVEGKPDVLIYKEGDAYKVTVFPEAAGRED